MKIKSAVTLSSALALTACFPVVLWTSTIEEANTTGSALPLATYGNTVYQLYPVETQLYLRKLSSTGQQEWAVQVDANLDDNLEAPRIKASANGPVVAYQNKADKTVFAKGFDTEGNERWSTDFGVHESETLNDLAMDEDGNISVAVRYTNTIASVFRFDTEGAPLWERQLTTCPLGTCVTTLTLDDLGHTLAVNTDAVATRLTLIDNNNGTQLWYKGRSTGISTSGLVPNRATPNDTGFVVVHPFVTFHYNYTGTSDWSYSAGSPSNAAVDGEGNIYVPGLDKISKLDSDGVLISEINVGDFKSIRKLAWHEAMQRLIVFGTYETVGPELDGSITGKSGSVISIFDAEGVRKARYKSRAATTKGSLCTPFPQCTTLSFTPGETWNTFSITADNKLVVSGILIDEAGVAKALKLL